MNHPTFKDAEGREWIVALAVPDVVTIRDTCNVDVTDPKDIATLDTDDVKAVTVLYVLCEAQAGKLAVSEKDFGRLFTDGEVLDAAHAALLQAITNFTRPHRRQTLQKVMDKQSKLQEAAMRRAEAILDSDQLDNLILRKTEESYQKSLGELLGNDSLSSLASSESTSPAPV